MEDKDLIRYKWDIGVYSLKDMIQFVEKNIINKDQFFSITRIHFDGVEKL